MPTYHTCPIPGTTSVVCSNSSALGPTYCCCCHLLLYHACTLTPTLLPPVVESGTTNDATKPIYDNVDVLFRPTSSTAIFHVRTFRPPETETPPSLIRTEPVRSRRRRFPSLSPSPSSPPVSARPCRAQPCASSAAPGCSGTAAGDGSGGYRCDLLEQTRSSPLEASKRSCRRPLPKTTTTTLGSSSSSSSSKREHPANLKSSYAKRNISGLVSRERGVARMAQAGGRRHLERDCRMGRYLLLRGRRLTSRKRARGKPAGTGSYYRME